jgi:hypothetical protein
MQQDMKAFGRTFKKQMSMIWNASKRRIETDRAVITKPAS